MSTKRPSVRRLGDAPLDPAGPPTPPSPSPGRRHKLPRGADLRSCLIPDLPFRPRPLVDRWESSMPCPESCARGSPKKVRHSSGPTDCSTGVGGSSTDSAASPHVESTGCGRTSTPPPTDDAGPGDRFRHVQHSTELGGPAACRRAPPRHHRAPRPDPRRRLRMAARQGHAGGDGLPRGGERLHPGADRAPGRAAPDDLRGDQGAHPRDRPVGADPQPRPLVLRPLLRGQGVRRQLPGPGDRPRRLDAAEAGRGLRPRPAGAARRGAAARPRRAGRGPRVLLARRLEHQPRQHPAGLLDRRGRRRAVHDPGPRPRHRASTAPTRSSASSAAPRGTRRASTSTTRPSTSPGAPTRSGGTRSAPTRPTTSSSTTSRTAGSSWASAAAAATGSSSSRPAPRSPPSTASSTPQRPRRRLPGLQPSGARGWSTPSTTR